MPAGAFGAVCPVGAILSTAFAAVPLRSRAADGYAAPKAPAGQSCSDDVFPVNTDDLGFPLTTDDCESRRRILGQRKK